MSERRNHVGAAYSLTVVAPIDAGREQAARDPIEALPMGPDSPLAPLGDLSRTIIDSVSDFHEITERDGEIGFAVMKQARTEAVTA